MGVGVVWVSASVWASGVGVGVRRGCWALAWCRRGCWCRCRRRRGCWCRRGCRCRSWRRRHRRHEVELAGRACGGRSRIHDFRGLSDGWLRLFGGRRRDELQRIRERAAVTCCPSWNAVAVVLPETCTTGMPLTVCAPRPPALKTSRLVVPVAEPVMVTKSVGEVSPPSCVLSAMLPPCPTQSPLTTS